MKGDTSDDSDSEDSEFEEVDASPEDMAALARLEADLESNPNSYDSYVQVAVDDR